MSYSEEQVREIFFEEMREIFEHIDNNILQFEQHPEDIENIRKLFRDVHTLKGSSGVFGLKEIAELTHHAEDLLDKLREKTMSANEEIASVLLRCFDRAKEMMTAAKQNLPLAAFDNRDLIGLLEKIKNGESEKKEAAAPAVPAAAAAAPATPPAPSPAPTEAPPAAPAPASPAPSATPPAAPAPSTPASAEAEKGEGTAAAQSQVAQYEIKLVECDSFFIMGINPRSIVLNAKDLATKDFVVETVTKRVGRLSELDPEKCLLEFRIRLSSDKPEAEVRDVFEFANSACSMGFEVKKAESKTESQTKPTGPTPVVSTPLEAKPTGPTPVVSTPLEAKPTGPTPVVSTPLEAKPTGPTPVVSTPLETKPASPTPVVSTPLEAKPASPTPVASTPAAKPAPAAASPASVASAPAGGGGGADQNDYLRIRKEKLDQLMNLVGELITVKNLFSHLANRIDAALPGSDISRQFKEGSGNVSRLAGRLQESVMNARMVPIGTVFSKYTRLVRDVSKKLGKKVNLVIEGEDTELDKTVSEAISDPLMHLLRNAIDHGIEMPDSRMSHGKPEVGTVLLRAGYEGNNVKIIVRDDGNGIDVQRIREKVLNLNLASAEQLDLMQKREIIDFIFHSGFSTASEITDVSGRGVGMDVVRNNIRKSGGSIFIESEVGKGTEFKLILPLSLAVIDALLIGCGNELYALPQEAIIESVKISRDELANLNNQPSINLRNEIIPVLKLADQIPMRASVLDEFIHRERNRMRGDEGQYASREAADALPIVIVQLEGTKVGIQVDELYWQEQIMIKPIGGFLSSIPIYSGACIMGNGNVVLVLEPKELYEQARNAERGSDRRTA